MGCELKKVKKEALKLFYISIDKKIHLWRKNSKNCYISEKFDDVYFHLDDYFNEIKLCNGTNTYIVISNYKDNFIPLIFNNAEYITNFKVWFYVRKVKKHFNKKIVTNNSSTLFLKNGIEKINKKYINISRKEKLKKLQ